MTLRAVDRQRKSFDRLVDDGVYDVDFDHAAAAKSFVSEVLRQVAPRLPREKRLKVLDCGCGTGAWLSFIHRQLTDHGLSDLRLCGFDLSERMVEVARQKLRDLADPADIRSGNALEEKSYAFSDGADGFDLVFAYDMIQQLPRGRQLDACDLIVETMRPEGVAVIFDNDCGTRFGRRMAVRKFLTRYCGLRLVPRYYCNAAYPPLEHFRRMLDARAAMGAEIVVRADGIKRALIVTAGGTRCEGRERQSVSREARA